MERLDVHICPANPALEQRPEILKPVSVNVSFGIRNGMVDHLMHIFIGQLVVGTQLVSHNFRTFFHVFTNGGVKIGNASTLENFATHTRSTLSPALQLSEHRGL